MADAVNSGRPSAQHPRQGSTRARPRHGFRRLSGEIKIGALLYAAKTPFFALPLYRWTLNGRAVVAPRIVFSDPWPGSAEAGRRILEGGLVIKGRPYPEIAPPWHPSGLGQTVLLALHGFDWLRDLRTAGGDAARRRARELTASWIEEHRDWHPLAWHPEAIGQRLSSWFGLYEFFAASADILFRQTLLQSAGRQAQHLARVLPAGLCGAELISAAKGLIFAGISLPNGQPWLARGQQLLLQEIHRQVQVDGGQAERCPSVQLQVLRDLVDIRALLLVAQVPVPPDLQLAIERMAAVLRLLRHGDGGLGLFNGGNEEASWLIDSLLQRASRRSKPLMSAPQTGFQRLEAGRSLVLVDAGAPPEPAHDRRAHAGTLSFEMSVGRERLIVNCGTFEADDDLATAARGTSAHSTLIVAETNSSAVLTGGGLGRRPSAVICRRQEGEGGIWLELSHDGYAAPHGVIHHRRLYLADSGEDLRGEDRLEGNDAGGLDFALRFHLHPGVQASLLQTGDAVLLRLPKGGGWRLRLRGAALALEDGVYLGERGHPRRCQQIVARGTTEAGTTTVKWALHREAPRGG